MHEINVFTNDGKLVKTMGERGVPGRGPNNFNRPTDIAWLPDGTFFVADGYAGTRVAKFDRTGKFLMDWGRPPSIPRIRSRTNSGRCTASASAAIGGCSSPIASITGCRCSTRTESSWRCGPPVTTLRVLAHTVTQDDFVWVADWTTDRLVKYDLEGHYILDIGGHGALPGSLTACTRSTSMRRATCM
jgi:hypothetical protein